MALRKPPTKKSPPSEALDAFVAGADDRLGDDGQSRTTSKKKASSKKTTKKKASKKSSGVEEKENYKYSFIIFPSYVEKIRILKESGINVQPRMRKLVYPLIDKLIEDLENE